MAYTSSTLQYRHSDLQLVRTLLASSVYMRMTYVFKTKIGKMDLSKFLCSIVLLVVSWFSSGMMQVIRIMRPSNHPLKVNSSTLTVFCCILYWNPAAVNNCALILRFCNFLRMRRTSISPVYIRDAAVIERR